MGAGWQRWWRPEDGRPKISDINADVVVVQWRIGDAEGWRDGPRFEYTIPKWSDYRQLQRDDL